MQQLTVSSLLRYLKNRLDLDNNLQKIYVSGEISNFHRHFSGHLYFSLKDESSAINCVMFKSNASSLKFEPKNGDKVILYANTSIFETTGQLQLYVLKISLDGIGDLYAQYEALKNKLAEEGFFNQDHKKNLSKRYLDKVAVLVGDKSAAMSDIQTTFNRRWPLCKTDFYPVLVQGNDAPNSIINMLESVDDKDYDAIILARGGGSFEDLFCFNDERLVKCIYNLKTFIITGVGHEQDYTLVDFVSDLRAPTPTASVELITPNILDVIEEIDDYKQTLNDCVSSIIERYNLLFDNISSRLLNFSNVFSSLIKDIDNSIKQIEKSLFLKTNQYKAKISNFINQISYSNITLFQKSKLNFKRYSTLLNAYSVNNTLDRGFTLVLQDNRLVKSIKDLKDSLFEVKFKDGSIKAIERK